jgi:hypothetical protein
MTILADFLRDAENNTYRLYPNTDGEIVIDSSLFDDDAWTAPTYTVPTDAKTVRTLADSGGNTWYLYVNTDGEAVLTDTDPTPSGGIWLDPIYGTEISETSATIGNEIYLALQDSASTDWYVYPNTDGELVISSTEPA